MNKILKDRWKYNMYRTHQNLFNNAHCNYSRIKGRLCCVLFFQNQSVLDIEVDYSWDFQTNEAEPGTPQPRPVENQHECRVI